MVYDTIYAFQDIDYDKEVGIQSSAIQFENNPKPPLAILAGLSTTLFGLTGYLAGLHPSYYVFLAGAAAHYAWQITTLDIKNKDRCRRMFISNQYLGWMLAFGFIFGKYFKGKANDEAEAQLSKK